MKVSLSLFVTQVCNIRVLLDLPPVLDVQQQTDSKCNNELWFFTRHADFTTVIHADHIKDGLL